MKMMFNGLDWSFKLLNSRYEREAREVLFFAKHHNITLYIAQNTSYFTLISHVLNFKWTIQTVKNGFHIKISLVIKFYIFLNFFYYVLNGYKIH
jgi:hypothetical protein